MASHSPTLFRWLAALVLATGCGTSVAQQLPTGAPYIPRDEAQVLQAVPSLEDAAVREIATLRARLSANPKDPAIALALARVYVDFGRRVGDAHYMGYAEAVIAPYVEREPALPGMLVLQSSIVQYRHEFARARALLEKVIAQSPRDAQAWLSLATLDMVQGDHAHAAQACGQVAKNGGVAIGIACRASLGLYTGQAKQSQALLTSIDNDARASPAYSAWLAGLMAEASERLGEWDKAEAAYQRALRAAPGDNFLLVAYADFLLDRGRAKDVLPLLEPYAESDTAYLRLALAHAALRDAQAQRFTFIMAARFAAYEQRGSEYFGREQARFALVLQRDPQTALRIARRNFEQQREPADVRVLLEAALAAGGLRDASAALAFIQQSKLSDVTIDALVAKVRAQSMQP